MSDREIVLDHACRESWLAMYNELCELNNGYCAHCDEGDGLHDSNCPLKKALDVANKFIEVVPVKNEYLKTSLQHVLKSIDEIILKHFDCEVPENTATPEPLASLQSIQHHILGTFIGLDEEKNADTADLTPAKGDS